MANPNWVKGVSGNAKGKPKGAKNKDSFGGLIRAKKGLKEELFNELCILRQSKDESIKLKATLATIEFGWGKAVQSVMPVDDKGQFTPYSLTVRIDDGKNV